jgi:homeobox protein ESX1
MTKDPTKPQAETPTGTHPEQPAPNAPKTVPPRPKEIGGPKGPEPTRYGDWERNGRVSDF